MKNKPSLSKLYSFRFLMLFANMLLYFAIQGQNGIKLNSPDAYNGYKLCTASSANTTYLLDNCGEIVHSWNNTNPQYYCRLTDEGNLIYISGNSIIERSWNNITINQATVNSPGLRLDYEVMKLENGNYLAAARRIKNSQYFNEIGWSPNTIVPDRIDGVVEIDPDGNIVWEWSIGDHTIQDKIPTASNFGDLSEHPELVDINAISDYDWQFQESFMINSIDYNPELDQILLSVRKVSELMVIDHSTTTEEAKGSTGGNSGKGGDILYRWGNPQNYEQGNNSDRVLYFQHNPNWVKYGAHKGKIIVFNNGLNRFVPGIGSMSSVHIINPPIDSDGNYMLESGNPYAPSEADITIDEQTTGTQFYSGYTSGAQVLPNGNIYITVGQPSDFLEVKTDGTLVWEYTLANSSYIFRSEQYARDFPGFEGKDLTPNGTVEVPSSSYNCSLFTSTQENEFLDVFQIYYNIPSKILHITNLESAENTLEIRNIQGQLVQYQHNVYLGTQISLAHLPSGIFYVTLFENKSRKRVTRKILNY